MLGKHTEAVQNLKNSMHTMGLYWRLGYILKNFFLNYSTNVALMKKRVKKISYNWNKWYGWFCSKHFWEIYTLSFALKT